MAVKYDASTLFLFGALICQCHRYPRAAGFSRRRSARDDFQDFHIHARRIFLAQASGELDFTVNISVAADKPSDEANYDGWRSRRIHIRGYRVCRGLFRAGGKDGPEEQGKD
jgi:hypothetical protein